MTKKIFNFSFKRIKLHLFQIQNTSLHLQALFIYNSRQFKFYQHHVSTILIFTYYYAKYANKNNRILQLSFFFSDVHPQETSSTLKTSISPPHLPPTPSQAYSHSTSPSTSPVLHKTPTPIPPLSSPWHETPTIPHSPSPSPPQTPTPPHSPSPVPPKIPTPPRSQSPQPPQTPTPSPPSSPFSSPDISSDESDDEYGIPFEWPRSRPMVNYAEDKENEEDYEIGWQWIEQDTGPYIAPYTSFRQCLLDPSKNNPEDFFEALFTSHMYTIMAEETNKYAHRKLQRGKYIFSSQNFIYKTNLFFFINDPEM